MGWLVVVACSGSSKVTPRASTNYCQATDLTASATAGDGKYTPSDVVEGVLAWTLHDGATSCLVSANAAYTLEDADGNPIEATIEITPPTDYDLVLDARSSDPPTFAIFDWTNWCGSALKGPLVLIVMFPQEPIALRVSVAKSSGPDGTVVAPPCRDPASPSMLTFPSGYWGKVASNGMSPCHASDLEIETDGYASLSARDLNGAYPGIEGSVRFSKHVGPGCTLTNWAEFELRDAHNALLDVRINSPIDVADRNPRTIYGPSNGYEKYVWTNWCGGPRPGPLHLVWTLPSNGGVIDWPVPGSSDSSGNIVTPPCSSPAPSSGSNGAGATPTPLSDFSIPRTF